MGAKSLSRPGAADFAQKVEPIVTRPLNRSSEMFWQFMLIIGLSGSLAFGQDKPAVDATIDPSHTELAPGDYVRQIIVGDRKRTYIVHVPEGYDAKKQLRLFWHYTEPG